MLTTETRTIANGSTSTERISVVRAVDGSFTLPAAFTGTAVQVRFTNNVTSGWTNTGSSISVAAGGTYRIPAEAFSANFIQLVSNATEAAERVITFGLRSK